MKAVIVALALLATTAGPVLAGSCDEDLRKLNAALQAARIAPDLKLQVEDMRTQAQQLCDAGNEEEGADVITEAVALLGVE